MNNKIYKLYLELFKKHGDPEIFWPQWCSKNKSNKLRELITIGAILTQRTSWRNADLALRNLKQKNLLSLKKIAELRNTNSLAELLRPAGFYQTKPRRLFELARFVIKEYGSLDKFIKEKLKIARVKLLSLYGVGPETADTILLYALNKPSFVIDEYTKRFVKNKQLASKIAYDYLKDLFEKNLPKDVEIYQNYHALIIVDQKGKNWSTMQEVK